MAPPLPMDVREEGQANRKSCSGSWAGGLKAVGASRVCLPSHTGPPAGNGVNHPSYNTFFQELILKPDLALRQVDMKENKREALLEMDEFACAPFPAPPMPLQ